MTYSFFKKNLSAELKFSVMFIALPITDDISNHVNCWNEN